VRYGDRLGIVFSQICHSRNAPYHYRAIPSLCEYVLVASDHQQVEVFQRKNDGKWSLGNTPEDDTILLASVDCAIALSEIYRDVNV